uniref:Uncharacterized protein n=1 Tax=Heterorhabditis bacteriophora TaxID=37862 RepID=A0A1I7WBR9_HETBA
MKRIPRSPPEVNLKTTISAVLSLQNHHAMLPAKFLYESILDMHVTPSTTRDPALSTN